ncbi:MAG: hypothetical protein K2X11_19145 [Acetobacteraceae bacterium]|nr:hypothetical protein [Acetobacteraceae bacterium]
MLRLAAALLLLAAPALAQTRAYCGGRIAAEGFSVAAGPDLQAAATYNVTLRNTTQQAVAAVLTFRGPPDFADMARDLPVTLGPGEAQAFRLATARGGDAARITAALPNMTEVECR